MPPLPPNLVLGSLLLWLALPISATAPDGKPGQQDTRQSLQELLSRLKRLRDDRLTELRDSVDTVLRAMETEAQTQHHAGLVEQKKRLVALGSECAPILVDAIDPGPEPSDAAKLLSTYVTQALVEQSSPAVTDRLVEVARTGSSHGKLNAAKALSASPDKVPAGAALAEIFRTSQGELRRVALTGIAHLGGPENDRVIAQALSAGDGEAIRVALEALASAKSTAFAPKVLALLQTRAAGPAQVDGLVAYYRACPEVVDKAHVLGLVRLAGDLSVDAEKRGKLLDLLPRFSAEFDTEVKKELRTLAASPTREVREGALVTLHLCGDRGARKDLLSDYDSQIDRNKTWPASYEARGNVLYRLGEHRDAIKDFQKSLALSANDFRARTEGSYIGLARCYAKQGKLKEAAQSLEKAPISQKQLADLGKEPVFQKLAEHPRFGKVFGAQ